LYCELRVTAPDLNKVKAALVHRSAILDRANQTDETETAAYTETNIWGEGVKIIRKCKPNRKPFTLAEKEDFVKKYQAGMSMGAIAREYGCNHSTIWRILKRMGVEIR